MKRRAALGLLLLLVGCVTRPPVYNRAWSTFDVHNENQDAAMLTYGRPGASSAELFAVCDRDAAVFEIAFFTGNRDLRERANFRTELTIGPAGKMRALKAETQLSPDTGELMVVARTGLPPTGLNSWVGERITIAAEGNVSTFLVRPGRAIIEDFLARCAPRRAP